MPLHGDDLWTGTKVGCGTKPADPRGIDEALGSNAAICWRPASAFQRGSAFRCPEAPASIAISRADQGRQRIPHLRRPGFIPVEAQGLHDRRVAEAEQQGWAVAGADVLAEGPGRPRKHVLVFLVEPPVADDRVAGALDHMITPAAHKAARL